MRKRIWKWTASFVGLLMLFLIGACNGSKSSEDSDVGGSGTSGTESSIGAIDQGGLEGSSESGNQGSSEGSSSSGGQGSSEDGNLNLPLVPFA